MSSSSIVIKVKYEETLRRFRASISYKKLALDIVLLKDKIRGFFGFGSGIEFTLTYVDEDGEAVILAGDDDLLDIVLQSLNPLRITVKLNKDGKLGGSTGTTVSPLLLQKNMLPYQTSVDSETFLLNSLLPRTRYSSSQLQPQSQTFDSAVSQSLKSSLHQIPLPSLTLNNVAESSTSESSRLLEKMNKAPVNPSFTFMAGGASNVTNSVSSTVKDSVSKVHVKPEVGSTNSKKKEKQVQKTTEDVESNALSFGFTKPFPTPFNANKGLEDSGSKLDSICVREVTVPNVTIMAPYTVFYKIWKMRNSGTLPWPQGSQLKWVSGDRLSNSDSVDIEVPADGLSVGKDLDIDVKITAPGSPGLYVSYWQMVSPLGQTFGNQVWVMVQVKTPVNDLGKTFANVNPPLVVKNPEVAGNSFIKVSNSEGATINSQSKDQGNDCDLSSNMATPSVYSATEIETALSSLPVGSDTESKLPPATQDDQEQGRLKDLEVMGFKQQYLNKEILRMNNFDLGKSVDDLCDVSEWDLMDDLQH